MVRTLRLSRSSAARLVVIVPFAAMYAAACGGSDTIPAEAVDGSADATPQDGAPTPPLDGATPDGQTLDGTTPDGAGADGTIADTGGGDVALTDGPGTDGNGNGDAADAGDAGARDASDGSSADGSDASDASDSSPPRDASDAGDGSTGPNLLGSAARFAVFSGATVSNGGTADTITGDLGTYPSTTPIGPTAPVVLGAQHLGDGVAQVAATDIQNAYNALIPGNLPCGTDLSATSDLGGQTLPPGVYCFSSTAALTGILTLDAQNNPNARWVFQIGSALTTASGSQVLVIRGPASLACNAWWQITSSATLGTNSVFGGNILALSAVTVTTGTTILGRTFGITAQVSTDTNIISIASCPSSGPLPDAGLPDASLPDTGLPDTGLPDTGLPDANVGPG